MRNPPATSCDAWTHPYRPCTSSAPPPASWPGSNARRQAACSSTTRGRTPPPLLVEADGTAHFLDEGRSPMLGLLPDTRHSTAVHPLPPSSTLLLYTDGLVERRNEDLTDGLDRLRRHASTAARRPLAPFCDELLAGMLTADNDDDTALVALRLSVP
ncbi:PP2C family protein-serine/threonine phosphatase [Streptomyces thermocarboxydus]